MRNLCGTLSRSDACCVLLYNRTGGDEGAEKSEKADEMEVSKTVRTGIVLDSLLKCGQIFRQNCLWTFAFSPSEISPKIKNQRRKRERRVRFILDDEQMLSWRTKDIKFFEDRPNEGSKVKTFSFPVEHEREVQKKFKNAMLNG